VHWVTHKHAGTRRHTRTRDKSNARFSKFRLPTVEPNHCQSLTIDPQIDMLIFEIPKERPECFEHNEQHQSPISRSVDGQPRRTLRQPRRATRLRRESGIAQDGRRWMRRSYWSTMCQVHNARYRGRSEAHRATLTIAVIRNTIAIFRQGQKCDWFGEQWRAMLVARIIIACHYTCQSSNAPLQRCL